MKPEEAKAVIEANWRETVDSDPNLHNAYLLVHSDKNQIHWNMAHGKTQAPIVAPEQPYHTASIGKTFTSVIIAMLVREGKLRYSDPISMYLSEEIMRSLHIYKGQDFSYDIRIEHLVSNTSGLPDYFEDKPKKHKGFFDMMLENPSRFWTPQETIEWTKQYLKPKFIPGKGVHYTNTGFDLLGLIIEKVTSKPYHEALHDYVFQPLDMNQSYLSQYSEPAERSAYPVAKLTTKNNQVINVEDYHSFSGIYASGQTISTSEDLFRFMQALVGYRLVPKHILTAMMNWKRLYIGVGYGYGLMKIRMRPFTQKFDVWGHLGSIGSFMLYNPGLDVYVIGNFNKTGYFTKSIRFISQVLHTLSKVSAD
jgi:D-alanyl-D-alanine carboxypeptidase